MTLRDQWHHVAVTVKGRNVTLYQDGRALIGPCSTGVLLGTPVQRPIDLAEKTCASIGQADRPTPARDTWWTFDAQIDDVQVYDRALHEDSIRYLHSHPGKSLSDFRQDCQSPAAFRVNREFSRKNL